MWACGCGSDRRSAAGSQRITWAMSKDKVWHRLTIDTESRHPGYRLLLLCLPAACLNRFSVAINM